MTITRQIQQLLKDHVVIRHRNDEELPNGAALCIICHRTILVPPESLCLMVDDEGLLCTVCGTTFLPDMVRALGNKLPAVDETAGTSQQCAVADGMAITNELDKLRSATDALAKGVARGIIEAPAGHIGLLHYAKEIRKPEQRPNESDKDYEMRLRSFRISYLYDKIRADTTGRIERVMRLVEKYLR